MLRTGLADTTDAAWRLHPYTRKGHLFLGAHPHRAVCGTRSFPAGYHPGAAATSGAAATYCARCIRVARRLPASRAAGVGR